MSDLTQIIITGRDQTQAAFASVSSGLGRLQSGFSSLNAVAGSLGAALGVAAIAAWAQETIAAASALDDLAEATGSTVESLSKLSNIAKVSGADFGTIDQALKKLAVGLAGTDEESSKAGKALAALGISARDPAQAMLEIAQRFDEFRDGPEKAALAVQIFGKAGASLVPILKDIAENQSIASTVTRQQAADAEALEKAWRRLGVESNSLKTALLSNVVPALRDTITEFNLARAAGLGFIQSLAVTDVANVTAALAEAQQKLADYEQGANKAASWLPGWMRITDADVTALRKRVAALTAIRDMRIRAEQDAGKGDWTPSIASGTKPAALTVPGGDAAARSARAAAEAARLAAAATKEWKEQEDALFDAQQRHEKLMADLAKGIADMQSNFAAYIDKQHDAIRAYEEQTDAIGKTTEELNAIELARQAEIRDMRLLAGWGDAAIAIYEKWAAAIGRRNAKLEDEAGRAAEKKFAEDWARTAERIGDGLTDAFMRAAESGRDFFKSLARDLYNMFSQLVLRPVIQGVMAPIAGGITSMLYGGGAAAQGTGGGGLGSLAQSAGSSYLQNSLFGGGTWNSALAGGVSSAFGASSFTAAAAGDAFLPAALGATGEGVIGFGAIAGEAFTALAAAAPYIAAVVAIAYAAYQAFGQEPGGPKLGGYASAGAITPWNRTDQFTDGGFQPGHFTPNQMDSALQPVVDSWVQGTAATIKALGGTSTAIGYDLGVDKDPNGTAPNRLGVRAAVNGQQVYSSWQSDLGRDDAALQAAVELESKRALVAALQASDLPAQIAAVFDTVAAETMSSAEVDNLMTFASAMRAAMDAISGSVLADAQTIWDNAQKNSVQNLQTMGDEVVRLAAAMDGSTESMQALAAASGSYRQAVVQVLLAIRQVAQQAEAMQGSLVQSIQTDGMDPFAAFNYWIAYANQQAAQLGSATSPEEVGAISTNVYNAINTAFGTLPAEVRDAYKQPLLGFLSEFGAGVNQALTNITGGVVGGTESPFTAVNTALTNAATVFDKVAPAMTTAASDMKVAAADMKAAVADFRAAMPLQVQVSYADHLV